METIDDIPTDGDLNETGLQNAVSREETTICKNGQLDNKENKDDSSKSTICKDKSVYEKASSSEKKCPVSGGDGCNTNLESVRQNDISDEHIESNNVEPDGSYTNSDKVSNAKRKRSSRLSKDTPAHENQSAGKEGAKIKLDLVNSSQLSKNNDSVSQGENRILRRPKRSITESLGDVDHCDDDLGSIKSKNSISAVKPPSQALTQGDEKIYESSTLKDKSKVGIKIKLGGGSASKKPKRNSDVDGGLICNGENVPKLIKDYVEENNSTDSKQQLETSSSNVDRDMHSEAQIETGKSLPLNLSIENSDPTKGRRARKSMGKRKSKEVENISQKSILSYFKESGPLDLTPTSSVGMEEKSYVESIDSSLHTPPCGTTLKGDSSSSYTPTKQPRAKKSFNPRSLSSNEKQVTSINLAPFAPLTIKVTELENVLGIKHKSLEKMDAKEIDRLVLQKSKMNKTVSKSAESSPSKCSNDSSTVTQNSIGIEISTSQNKDDNVSCEIQSIESGDLNQCHKDNAERHETESPMEVGCVQDLIKEISLRKQALKEDKADLSHSEEDRNLSKSMENDPKLTEQESVISDPSNIEMKSVNASSIDLNKKRKYRKVGGNYSLPGCKKQKKKSKMAHLSPGIKRSRSQDSFKSEISVDSNVSSLSTRSAQANLMKDRFSNTDNKPHHQESEMDVDSSKSVHDSSCPHPQKESASHAESDRSAIADLTEESFNVLNLSKNSSNENESTHSIPIEKSSENCKTVNGVSKKQHNGNPILLKIFSEISSKTTVNHALKRRSHKRRKLPSWKHGYIKKPGKAQRDAKDKNRTLKEQMKSTLPQLKAIFQANEIVNTNPDNEESKTVDPEIKRRSERKRKTMSDDDFVYLPEKDDGITVEGAIDVQHAKALGFKVFKEASLSKKHHFESENERVGAVKPLSLAELSHEALSPPQKSSLGQKHLPRSKRSQHSKVHIVHSLGQCPPEDDEENVKKVKNARNRGFSTNVNVSQKSCIENIEYKQKVAEETSHSSIEKPQLKFVFTPNGRMYPVTPPVTPETSSSSSEDHGQSVNTGKCKEDPMPLCCCKLNGISMSSQFKGTTYCQALDSYDGRIIGCCNKATASQLFRPSVRITFMALCELHRTRLKQHRCCPGCGHFCNQGKFVECQTEGSVHIYHKQCQILRDNKYHCPHCAKESTQKESTVKGDPPITTFAVEDKKSASLNARMNGTFSASPLNNISSPGLKLTIKGKAISADDLPTASRKELEAAMALLHAEEKPKRLKCGNKNLYNACKSGDLEKVVYLLNENIDPNMRFPDHENETALHTAAANGHFGVCYLLLQSGASAHVVNDQMHTPLMEASAEGHTDTVELLHRAGAQAEFKAEDEMTALHLAAQAGHVDCVRYLVERARVDLNLQDDGGWTALVWAAEHRHLHVVQYLLTAGADPNMRDNEENTGLHWAAFAGSVDIAEMLLDAGCQLEAANEHGDRPLHIAARQDSYKCVALFLVRGADCETRNNVNDTPISCCIDQTSCTWMALRVNGQLKAAQAGKHTRPERLVHRDISFGKEANPIPVVNGIDDETYPQDFLYINGHVETSPVNINTTITSLQSCRCKDNCNSVICACTRSGIKCWYTKEGKLTDDFNYTDPPLVFECNKGCRCWANCANRVVQMGITCRLQVFRTEGRGWGARTLLPIKKGSYVCEYIGELISDAEADSREDDSYLFDLDNKVEDTFCIDARQFGNIARFINHLCEPNVIPVKVFMDHQDLRFPRICFFANRDIAAHEELGFDYGDKFWIIKWKQFTCECQSPRCRYNKVTIHKTIEDFNKRLQDDDIDEPFM